MLLTSPLSSPLKNPVRDVFSPAGGSPSLTAQVQALFAGGKVGGMWDMGDTSKLFQDSATLTTPVTAPGQTIGLVLDSKSTTVDATVITNGDFSVGTGWTMPAGVSISSGALRCTAASGYVYQNAASMTSGDVYKVTYTVSNYSGGSIKAYVNATPVFSFTVSANGVSTGYIRAGSSSLEVGFNLTGFTGDIDDFSVCRVPGNHATQPTAGSRPLCQVESGYMCAQFDGTDDELFTGALTPNSDMDCFIAIYRNSAARSVVAYDQLTGGFCVMDSGDAASTATFGIPATNTYAVDGVSVAGGTGTTRAQLASAVSPGAWHIIEARNLNLSSFSPLRVGNYGPTWPLEGKIGGIVLISALSTADRNLVRTYLGSKVGLTL